MVRVGSVDVLPDAVNAVQGGRIQLVATVHDQDDQRLDLAGVQWASGDAVIASVDSRGMVDALAPGSVIITASFQGVSGKTNVRVLRGSFLEVTPASVEMFGGPGASPEARVVDVRNGGTGASGTLSVETAYGAGQPGGWLTANLSGATPPTQLTLGAGGVALLPGVYGAQVRVASSTTNAATLAVALNVAGFEVEEVGGSTLPREGGDPEHLSVVLASRPGSAVVLDVRSSDAQQVTASPASLRFVPSSWNVPQTVAISAVNDAQNDGDRTVAVTMSVIDGQSHDAFEELADQSVNVTAVDDDGAERPQLIALETAGGTAVTEQGTVDTIFVALTDQPVSNVVISVTSANPLEVAVASSAFVTITPFDWTVPKAAVVRGVDDLANDGNSSTTVTLAVVDIFSPQAYRGASSRVTVRNVDNDQGGRGRGGGGDDDDDEDDSSGPGPGG